MWIKDTKQKGVTKGKKYTEEAVKASYSLTFDVWWERMVKHDKQRRKKGLEDTSLKEASDFVLAHKKMAHLTNGQRRLVGSRLAMAFDNDYGVDPALLPLRGLGHRDGYGWKPIGGEDHTLDGGMSRVSDLLRAGDPARANGTALDVRLGHVVTHVAHGPEGCAVTYSTGEGESLVVALGSACLVAVPLGVLMGGDGGREGDIAFAPALGGEKQVAIQTRGMAYTNLSLIKFSEPFWEEVDPGKTSWRYVPKKYEHVLSQDFKFFENWFVAEKSAEHFVLGAFWEGDQYWAESLKNEQLERKFVRSLKR